MLLKGFGFSGYRSFGNELTKIAPLKKINLIIGQNNVGKSNIINFLNEQFKSFHSKVNTNRNHDQDTKTFTDIDVPMSENIPEYKISFPIFKDEIDEFIEKKLSDPRKHRQPRIWAKKLLTSDNFIDENGTVWITHQSSHYSGPFSIDLSVEDFLPILSETEWYSLWEALTNQTGGELRHDWIPETLTKLAAISVAIPNIEVIPAIRKIGLSGSQATDYSGEGIIERLAKIQNPPLEGQDLKEKFSAINKFLQEVIENKSAEVEIPFNRDMILVHMDGKTLPLESLGTGVHEVVILAAASTLLDNTILCVEEPELHLHPLLQRKLLKYLFDKTNNQYFFTTHSAHLLDVVESEIFHVTQIGGRSKVDVISSTKKRSNICRDLGYKASDILQANCIIWVEGPSDRIYLNFWLAHENPDLIEGIHYSIMFFGGRLFSHLTAMDDDEINEITKDFISIRNLNRNSVIIFDSDMKNAQNTLTATKQRLEKEFNNGDGFSWVTAGREVENYLNYDKVEESVIAVHPSAKQILDKGKWANLLQYKKIAEDKNKRTANKVKVARHYIDNNTPNLKRFDLGERITQLSEFIIKINNHEI